MEGLPGFHRPQFSEETAWVPGWLQQLHFDNRNEHIEVHTPNDWRFEGVAVSQQNFLSSNEGRYSCHLFLSGEDNSPLNFSASSGGVAQFHLQLSSVGKSQDMLSSFSEAFQAERDLNYECIMQKNDVSPEEEANEQFEVDQSACREKFPIMPRNEDTTQNDSLCDKKKDAKLEREEIIGDPNLLDIRDAVELSIAATEALSIHEILSSCSCVKGLSAEAVIEIALRVKQARLNCSENICDSLNKDDEEGDFLLDLDDSSMEGAFADVGICTGGSNDFYVSDSEASYVKDTPSFDKHHGDAYGSRNPSYQTADNELDFQVTKDIPNEFLHCENLIKAVENSVSVLKISNISCHNGIPLHSTLLPTSNGQFGSQEVNFASEDMSMKPRLKENLLTLGKDDEQATTGPERFQSRWLGGWTSQKEMAASRILRADNTNYVPRFLVRETSYLTESADIAPDESSVVRAHDKGLSMASQSSVQFARDRAENFAISPQDVMMCSSPSLVDPLCSIVPCSIPDNENDDIRCDSSTETKFHNIDLQALHLNVESGQHHNFIGSSSVDSDDSNTRIRRQWTSLKDYSMVLPHLDSLADKQSGSPLLSSEHTMAPTLVISVPKLNIFDRPEENHGATHVKQNPSIYPKSQREDCIDTERIGSDHLLSGKKRASSSFILNSEDRDMLQASKHAKRSSPQEVEAVNSEDHDMFQASKLANRSSHLEVEAVNSDARVQPDENLQKEQSGHEISPHAVLSTKKRVHFSESVIEMQKLEKHNEREVSRQYCSNKKDGLIVRNAKYNSMFRAKEDKRHRRRRGTKKDSQILNLQDLEFMLTGFTRRKEKELEDLIRKHGGIVLHDIPCPDHCRNRSVWLKKLHVLVILCPKKLETTKFLFGCAVDACILKANWLTDSIVAGSTLAPEKYFLLPNRAVKSCTRFRKEVCSHVYSYIFQNMGFMLHVKGKFCTKLAKIIKYGGGKVFKTLHWLAKYVASEKNSFGAIVAEDHNTVSRHLKQCASKSNISVLSVSCIINNLYSGPKFLPLGENNNHFTPPPLLKTWNAPVPMDVSQEI
ncbi:uncharacterized protein LOC124919482 [Impatiens glandulifera]|uniref:uncharacterized protein LOC124919482 n=1 Tax=Impatiens glandulifera TaxID=253017 RepID=UPI001FB0E8C4|nr:uncharacterized protein LOC124919482 [Impatiens glandulifera]